MIEVLAPAGWQPPDGSSAEKSKSSSDSAASPVRNEPLASHFDDIDSLLKSTDTPSPVGRSKSKSPKKQKLKSAANPELRRPGTLPTTGLEAKGPRKSKQTANPPAGEPILPTDQWTTPAAQLRKKKLTLIVSICAAGLLLLAGSAAVYNWVKSSSRKVAENIEQNGLEPVAPEIESAADPGTKIAVDLDGNPEGPADPDTVTDPTLLPATDSLPTKDPTTENPVEAAVGIALPIDMTPPPVLLDPGNSNPTTNEGPLGATTPTKVPLGNGANENVANQGGFNKVDLPTQLPLGNIDSLGSQMGELSVLLNEAGTSFSRIQDLAAAERDEQLIGIPKYFIAASEPDKFDLQKQLELPSHGWKYTRAQLSTVVNDFTAITGVPLTIDPASLLALPRPSDPVLDVDLQEMDFSKAIDTVIQPLGLVKSPAENVGLRIQIAGRETFAEQIYSLPKFPTTVATEREVAAEELISGIRSLIAPDSWLLEQNPATISIVDDQIKVYNSMLAQYQIEEFLKKVGASIELLADPANPVASQSLTPRWEQLTARLDQPAGLVHRTDQTLVRLLEELRKKTGVTVWVDWNSVQSLGWTPRTKVPGQLVEETLSEALRQLARSLKLTLVAIDEKTVLLTTFEEAAAQLTLECYPFGKLLSGKLNVDQALALIMETLGPQLQSNNIRFVYEPKYQVFVLLAPQSLHRQLTAVIKKLENL